MVYKLKKINQLKPWDKNPRGIKKDDFNRLKNQIKEFGLYKPFLVTDKGEVLGGNMRYRACLDLGIKNVPVSIVKPKNDAEKLKYALSDNDRAGYYEEEQLAELVMGFDNFPIDDFKVDLGKLTSLEDLINQFGPEVEEDEVPEVEEGKPKSKLGEVYTLGRHRLMCGDATKIKDVEKLMDGKKADMVFTDPPYNVDYGISKKPRHKYRKIKGDKQDAEGWEAFNRDWISSIVIYNKGDIYVWGASGPEGMKQRLWLNELGYHWSATIIWKKQQLVLTPANYQRMYEPCFYGWAGKSSYRGNRKQTEVWEIDRPHDSKLHPTMKPIAVCSRGIKNSSKQDDIVLDLFGGSGSTLIACEQTNRTCYMMELDPKYCDVIRKRYDNFVNK